MIATEIQYTDSEPFLSRTFREPGSSLLPSVWYRHKLSVKIPGREKEYCAYDISHEWPT